MKKGIFKSACLAMSAVMFFSSIPAVSAASADDI